MFPIFLFQHTDKNKDKNPEFQQDQSNNTYTSIFKHGANRHSPFTPPPSRGKKYLIYESELSKCQMARIFYESCLRFSQIISRQGNCTQIILYLGISDLEFFFPWKVRIGAQIQIHRMEANCWQRCQEHHAYVKFLCSTCI